MIILILDNQADEYMDGEMFIKTAKKLQVNTKCRRQELLHDGELFDDYFLQGKMKTLIRKTLFDPEDKELFKDILLAMEHLDEKTVEIVKTEEKADKLNVSPKTRLGPVFMPNVCDVRFVVLVFTFALAQSLFILTFME